MMKYQIHGEWPDGSPDSIIVEAETLDEIRGWALIEADKRAWRNCWSEELIDDTTQETE